MTNTNNAVSGIPQTPYAYPHSESHLTSLADCYRRHAPANPLDIEMVHLQATSALDCVTSLIDHSCLIAESDGIGVRRLEEMQNTIELANSVLKFVENVRYANDGH